jgi:hypothetical protein
MTSEKQRRANQINGPESRGPKTQEGKRRARKNALKHGLCAQQVVVEGEDPDEFEALSNAVHKEAAAEGALEEQLVDRFVICLWRLHRVGRLEAAIFAYQALVVAEESAKRRLANLKEAETEQEALMTKAFNLDPEDNESYDEARGRLREAQDQFLEYLPALGAAFIHDALHCNALAKLSRYETAIERSMLRALHELQRLQAVRLGGAPSVPTAVDVTIDGSSTLVEE